MAATTTTAISQLSCFGSINRKLHLHQQRPSSVHFISLRPKLSVVRSIEGQDAETSSSRSQPKLSYAADVSGSSVEKLYPAVEGQLNDKVGVNGHLDSVVENKKSAKIHDFCFGIPFGGFILTGGIIGSIFSRNVATLGTGVLFGGAVLAFSTISMKVWREGKSSFPFIMGQAALAATLLWKNFQSYSMTKKIFPSGLYALVSAAMLLFYSYVVVSGGNPPPKKLKAAADAA